MAKIFTWLYDNLYRYMVPIGLLNILRIVICYLELGRIKQLREKQHRFLSGLKQTAEIYAEAGCLIGVVFTCLVSKLWFVGWALCVVLAVLGYKKGKAKGLADDEFWRGVGLEMQKTDAGNAVEGEDQPRLEETYEHGIDGILNAAMDYGTEEEKEKE